VRLEGLGQLKKSNELIGIRTRDLPACDIVPQPTTLPRAPRHEDVWGSGQLHAPAAVPPGKAPPVGLRAGLDALPLQVMESRGRPSSPQAAVVSTELHYIA
jgi:hypothetical protein